MRTAALARALAVALALAGPGWAAPSDAPPASVEAFLHQPSDDGAAAVAAEIIALSDAGDWTRIAAVDLGAIGGLLDRLPQDLATELLLLSAYAKGFASDPDNPDDADGQDALVALADRFAGRALNPDAARVLSINLGYAYLQTGQPEKAFARLDKARVQLEAAGLGDELANLCGLASNQFAQASYLEQAATLYSVCDASPVMRGARHAGRGQFWHNYAMFLRDAGDLDAAITRHQWALNDLSDEYGFPSPPVVDAYDALSQTLLLMGELGSADTTATMAIGYSEQLDLQETDAHWRVVNNAASIKRALRLPAQALALDVQAYEWRVANLGEDHPLTYASWVNLALDLVELERWDEARREFAALFQLRQAGQPVPYGPEVIGYYLAYIDARTSYADGGQVKLPPLNPLLAAGAPMELIVGAATVGTQALLRDGLTDDAIRFSGWLRDFATENLGATQPFSFEARLLAARALAARSPVEASEALAGLDQDLFNWVRRQSLSGSYDAAVAGRKLADDLLITMARHAVEAPDFTAHFAGAIHRWKTLEDGSDQRLDEVARNAPDAALRQAARAYALDAARFRERVRAEPVSDQIAGLDAALTQQRDALNALLLAEGLPLMPAPLDPVDVTDAGGLAVTEGDVVIDMILLRDWQGPDRSGDAQRMQLYAAVFRADAPVQLHLVADLDFDRRSADQVYADLWRDFGLWVSEQAGDARRVFLAPDAMLFQMDLTAAQGAGGARLGESHDIYLLTSRSAYARAGIASDLTAGDRVVLAGGLYFDDRNEDSPDYLSGSLAEIEDIDRLVSSAGTITTRLQGAEATEPRLAETAAGAQLIHLATHGFFRDTDDQPFSLQNAGIVLSAPAADAPVAPENDGIAHASELMGWALQDAELVVLSSCESGVGRDTPIDAVRGLPLALARAGARRSLVTLEQIPDRQTAAIMERFYEHLTGDDPGYAAAFNATKRDIWAGRISGVATDTASAFVFYNH